MESRTEFLTTEEALAVVKSGGLLIDIRPFEEFDKSFPEGAISVEYSKRSYAERLSQVVHEDVPLVLVGEEDEQLLHCAEQLRTAGREVAGFLHFAAWVEAGLPTGSLPEIDIEEMRRLVEEGRPFLDIREEIEWEFLGGIPGAFKVPLPELPKRINEVRSAFDPDNELVILCSAGLRSATAASLLARHGFTNLVHPPEGLNGWMRADLPLERQADSS